MDRVAAGGRRDVFVGGADHESAVVERKPASEPAGRLSERRQHQGRLDPTIALALEDEDGAGVLRDPVVVGGPHRDRVAIDHRRPAVLVGLGGHAGEEREAFGDHLAGIGDLGGGAGRAAVGVLLLLCRLLRGVLLGLHGWTALLLVVVGCGRRFLLLGCVVACRRSRSVGLWRLSGLSDGLLLL